jgi:hypothetical protein
MRHFPNFSFIAWLLLTSCNQNVKHVPKQSEFELSANLGGIGYLDTIQTIHIATTLFNPTNDTLSFVTMTCSYEDLFLTDTSIFKVQSRYDCFKNGPIVTSIPPGEKIDQFIMISPISKDIKIGDHKLRIGMYLLTPKKEDGFEGIAKQYEQRQNAKIIWSNEIDLKRLYRRIYR